MTEPQLFRIHDAAPVLNIHPGTLRTLVRTGKIPSVRVGSRQMITRATLDAILAGAR